MATACEPMMVVRRPGPGCTLSPMHGTKTLAPSAGNETKWQRQPIASISQAGRVVRRFLLARFSGNGGREPDADEGCAGLANIMGRGLGVPVLICTCHEVAPAVSAGFWRRDPLN